MIAKNYECADYYYIYNLLITTNSIFAYTWIIRMETITIELTNPKAYKLLEDMEELNLIRVLKEPSKLSSIRGRIKTPMTNEKIDKQLTAIR